MYKSYIAADSAEKRLIAEIKSKGVSGILPSLKGKGSIMQGIQFMQGFKIYIICQHCFLIMFIVKPQFFI
ncbi:terminase large subunit [Streptococcus agalactiae]|uniref:terminase large subunit n=1 Tax=Streptococcus agalactiae TaxID=1311 RepID=UPI003643E0FD